MSGEKRGAKVNQADLEWQDAVHGDSFAVDRKQLGSAAGGQQLGTSLCRSPCGKKAWPFHGHYGNEEAIYIHSGQGTMRVGDQRHPAVSGDYFSFPTGEENAHQLINNRDESLVYLCISTMHHPDVMVYPDSGKVGIVTGSAPGGSKRQRRSAGFFPGAAAVDY